MTRQEFCHAIIQLMDFRYLSFLNSRFAHISKFLVYTMSPCWCHVLLFHFMLWIPFTLHLCWFFLYSCLKGGPWLGNSIIFFMFPLSFSWLSCHRLFENLNQRNVVCFLNLWPVVLELPYLGSNTYCQPLLSIRYNIDHSSSTYNFTDLFFINDSVTLCLFGVCIERN